MCSNQLMTYNWQQPDWTKFTYDISAFLDELTAFEGRVGRVSGVLEALPEGTQVETLIEVMVSEAIKTSEIEGEYLSRADVMSSIRRNLGLTDAPPARDARAAGVAELMVAVRREFASPLTEGMLFDWHRMLMRGNRRISAGAWRTHEEPMQVVSGAIGRETVHYEAPPSADVPKMMARFVDWFNATAPGGDKPIKQAPIRSALAHLYFESVHPFEDGNGRIGRTISEKALSQGLGRPVLLSLSKAIESDRNAYYDALKSAQRTNETTDWIRYFLSVCLQAQQDAEEQIDFTLQKVKFFDMFKDKLNKRQTRVIRRMLDEGPKGFEGGMSANKYVSIAKTSKPSATRDLQALAEMKALIVTGGGRSTRYWLPFDVRAKAQERSPKRTAPKAGSKQKT
nr:Fic family protein [Marinicaulis flavus]